MSEPSKAVFLSYASQDAEAARRICETLRAAGIEVWFDQSELRGGDVWDQKIRQQIHDCALFVPVISTHTNARAEGYFRLEWKLAVDRSYLMADDAPFLFPLVIDETTDAGARVPEKFRTVQWTRLPAGEAPEGFAGRVSTLLSGAVVAQRTGSASGAPSTARRRPVWLRSALAVVAAALIAIIAIYVGRISVRRPTAVPTPNRVAASPIPANSIAVLPFVDVSADGKQGFLSDGLSEELLNLISKVPGMQVAARTSAFSFKGHATDVRSIGRQLMVAHVLEGSVNRVGKHLRVTAQLERTDNGYQVWSETYDRELGDVFRIQDEIATAVVKSLKGSLQGSAAPRNPGTQNSDAYLALLQGRAKMATERVEDFKAAQTDFERAIRLDPTYAPAYGALANAKINWAEFAGSEDSPAAVAAAVDQARLLLERAIALDPKDPQPYIVRGYIQAFSDNGAAERDYRRAIELNPNAASAYGGLATLFNDIPSRWGEVLPALDRARQLDPLEPNYDIQRALFFEWKRSDIKQGEAILRDVVAHHPTYAPGWSRLADARLTTGHIAEAIMLGEQALRLNPLHEWTRSMLIKNYLDLGDTVAAHQVAAEGPHPLATRSMLLQLHEGGWHQAATTVYATYAKGPLDPITEIFGVVAMRIDARESHDYSRVRAALEQMCGVTWTASGVPMLPHQQGFGYAAVGLGEALIASGDRERGVRLLRASLADMDYVEHDLHRGGLWYAMARPVAYALLGERERALSALPIAAEQGYIEAWRFLSTDPAYEALRGDPKFQAVVNGMEQKRASERRLLEQLRAAGRVPNRDTTASASHASGTGSR